VNSEPGAAERKGTRAMTVPCSRRGQSPAAVLVVAAEDCPHEDAQRADRLAEDLSRNGVPVLRTHHIGFTLAGADGDQLERINVVMKGPLPIVFVRGRAKANPLLKEVLAEFKGAGQ
jgi:hypothetical protein